MKKILTILLLTLGLSLQAQDYQVWLGDSLKVVWSAQASGGGDYPAVLDDGNTEAWFIADVDNYITVGDTAISQWNDVSGNDNHLTQGTGIYQPKYADDTVFFSGSNFMTVSIATLEQPTTVYAAVKLRSYVDGDYIFDGYGSSNLGAVTMTGSPNTMAPYAGNLAITISFTPGDTEVLIATFNSTSSYIQFGTATNTGDAGTNDMIGFTLGGRGSFSSSRMSEITVYEIIIRSAADGSSDRGDIVSYLEEKHSL